MSEQSDIHGLFLVGDEDQVRVVPTGDGHWYWQKEGEEPSTPYLSEYAATQAARSTLGHHPRRNYQRGASS